MTGEPTDKTSVETPEKRPFDEILLEDLTLWVAKGDPNLEAKIHIFYRDPESVARDPKTMDTDGH